MIKSFDMRHLNEANLKFCKTLSELNPRLQAFHVGLPETMIGNKQLLPAISSVLSKLFLISQETLEQLYIYSPLGVLPHLKLPIAFKNLTVLCTTYSEIGREYDGGQSLNPRMLPRGR